MSIRSGQPCARCGVTLKYDTAEGFCPGCMLEGALLLSEEPVVSAERRMAEPELPSLGDYQLLEEIARGGMGVVYRARQLSLNRIVAVKLILVGQFADKAGVKRFKAEASAVARLRHPNIVAIHEIGEEDGRNYFSMEYVEGPDLAMFSRQHPVSIRQAAQLVKKVAEAVQYAHERGIVHRDLKPSNILVDGLFEPRITDFGLARDLEADGELTVTGQVLGSPSYISPEQATGRVVGPASDIYSLGALLYYLLSGRPPFAAETLTATLQQVNAVDPVSPRMLNPSVPRDIETICLKCLEKEPEKRYASAGELVEELDRFLSDEPIRARPISAPAKAWRWCRRKPVVAGLAAAFVTSLLLGFAGVVWQWQIAERNLYAADMLLAQNALSHENMQHAKENLEKYLPKWWKNDLRGWEWYYAWDECRGNELYTIEAHELPVLSLAVSQDGSQLLSGGSGPVILWDVQSRKKVKEVFFTNTVYGAAFSVDERLVFAGTSDGRFITWDLATGEAETVFTNLSAVRSLILSKDGRSLGIYTADRGLALYRVPGFERIEQFEQTQGTDRLAAGMAFSSDSTVFAYAIEGGDIALWNMVSGSELARLQGHESSVTGLVFSLDDSQLVSSSRDGTVRVWEIRSGKELRRVKAFSAFASGLGLSHDGKLLGVVGAGQHVRLFETENWEQIHEFKGHNEPSRAVVFTRDGTQLITAGNDGTIKFWPAVRDTAPATRRLALDIASAELLPGGNLLLQHQDGNHTFESADGMTKRPAGKLPSDGPSVLAPDGRIRAVARKSGVQLIDSETDLILTNILLSYSGNRQLYFAADSQSLAIKGYDSCWQVWKIGASRPSVELVSQGRQLQASQVHSYVPFDFSRDGKVLSFLNFQEGIMEVWPVHKNHSYLLRTNWQQNDIAISADHSIAVSACGSGVLRVWDLKSGRQIAGLGGQLGTLWSVEFSPDDTRIAACGGDGSVRIWDRRTLRPVAALKLQNERLEQLTFSADGETLYVLGVDSFKGFRLFTLRAPRLPNP